MSEKILEYESDIYKGEERGHPKRLRLKFATLLVPLSFLAVIIFWELGVRMAEIPAFILPPPSLILERMWESLISGTLIKQSLYTLLEVLVGLTIGVIVATVMGYFLAKSVVVERVLSPYIVASQSIPIVAIAPLLVIWFGPGVLSKILICALIVFFPVLINTIVGIRTVPEDLRDLMRSLKANRWQTIRLMEFPSALPVFLGGLRIGATLAVIGAVVGEFVGADRGLGFLINVARGQYDTALVFVAVLALILMAMGLYGSVTLMERRLLAWRDQPN